MFYNFAEHIKAVKLDPEKLLTILKITFLYEKHFFPPILTRFILTDNIQNWHSFPPGALKCIANPVRHGYFHKIDPKLELGYN